jgi:hypothetical protein
MTKRCTLDACGSTVWRATFWLAIGLYVSVISARGAHAAGGQVGNLSGTVIDTRTGAPVVNAVIGLAAPSGAFTSKTSSGGFFTVLGVPVDTYVLSISAQGYDAVTLPGMTVQGDQMLSLGTVRMMRQLRTIGHVSARSTNGAFQPTQTTDSYTVSGARIIQTTGKPETTDENQLLLAVPGVTLTNSSIPTIRGGAAREVGYQYDGVPFTEPFLASNGSGALILGNTGSGAVINGVGSVQVVEGAGDATQGNVGSGVINVIPKRGTRPSFGLIDLEIGGPAFSHQAAFEYGFANAKGTLSDYVAYNGQRIVPYYGYTTTNVAAYLNYFGTSYQANDQFTNNFVYRFGKNNGQSLQVLYTNISLQQWGDVGGIPRGTFPSNPDALTYYPYDTLSQAPWIALAGAFGMSAAQYAQYIGLGPGVPATNVQITRPEETDSLQTRLLKLEYDDNLNANTYLALRYYNWEQLLYQSAQYSIGPANGGLAGWDAIGGPTTGASLDLTQQVGSRLTVNVNAKYDVLHPIQDSPSAAQLGILGLYLSGIGADNPGGIAGPSPADWLPGGYLSKYFPKGIPRIPIWGLNYNKSFFQNWGTGIRLQYQPIQPLKFDVGVRYEGQNQHWFDQLDQYGQGVPADIQASSGPFDVPPSFWVPEALQPREWEPRASVVYRVSVDDALRFGYGRSAVFGNAFTVGQPFNVYNLSPFLNVPPVPGFRCGIPAVKLFPCKSYGEQLYWIDDQIWFPDAGNSRPALYSNYDLGYSHQFRNGFGLRVTPFYKLGTSLPVFSLTMPLPGGGSIATPTNQGFNRTTGVEASLTTPDRPSGFSGFLSATYQNVLSTTPPLSLLETLTPNIPPATLALGDLYRAGYVSPFSVRLGGTYAMKNGFSTTPALQYNVGYPYSVGNLIAAAIGPHQYANFPQIDFGPGVPVVTGIGNVGGAALSTNYYDPAYSGSLLHPNIAATRGTPATAANGGYLSSPNLQVNLTLQYKRQRNVVGVQILNAYGNAFTNSVPATNPFYQPVANGLSGPQTNYNWCASPAGGFGTSHGCVAQIPKDTYAFVNGAYLLSNGNFTGAPVLAPLQPMTIQLYFQRQL